MLKSRSWRSKSGRQRCERLRPRHGLEGVALPDRSGGTQAAPRRIDEEDVGNESRVLRGIHPRVVTVGVLLRGAVAGGDGADLQGDERASHLEVERLAELERGVAQVALHALALGLADLTDPPVLQDGEGRQQDQQGGR